MLVIPIEESLIYVRPLYLRADAGKIPELKRVIVGYEDTIAMERTLEEALAKIFGEESIQNITTTKASVKRKSIKTAESKSDMQLKQTDYQTIKNMFERVMKRQEEMNQKLSNHKEDLKVLGKALDSAIAID
jgi:uncharacterized membrane protein (UPF0182 family)